MSQATFTTADLLNLDTNTAVPVAKSHASFFGVRSSLMTILATGAIAVICSLGMAKVSDNVVESNARSVAASCAVPPAEYYAFVATMQAEEAAGLTVDEAAAAPAMDSAAAVN